jgi:hypothetical protein
MVKNEIKTKIKSMINDLEGNYAIEFLKNGNTKVVFSDKNTFLENISSLILDLTNEDLNVTTTATPPVNTNTSLIVSTVQQQVNNHNTKIPSIRLNAAIYHNVITDKLVDDDSANAVKMFKDSAYVVMVEQNKTLLKNENTKVFKSSSAVFSLNETTPPTAVFCYLDPQVTTNDTVFENVKSFYKNKIIVATKDVVTGKIMLLTANKKTRMNAH